MLPAAILDVEFMVAIAAAPPVPAPGSQSTTAAGPTWPAPRSKAENTHAEVRKPQRRKLRDSRFMHRRVARNAPVRLSFAPDARTIVSGAGNPPTPPARLSQVFMDRFTISLDENLAAAFDRLIKDRGYSTRSEAVRDILRSHLQVSAEKRNNKGACVATLSYVYNHHERELAERLTGIQHAHHDLTVSTMHAHLDHEQCIETVILKGSVTQVRDFAEKIIAERGVRHGQLNLISVEFGKPHSHGGTSHRHLKPQL